MTDNTLQLRGPLTVSLTASERMIVMIDEKFLPVEIMRHFNRITSRREGTDTVLHYGEFEITITRLEADDGA